jgi:hypothetical protein
MSTGLCKRMQIGLSATGSVVDPDPCHFGNLDPHLDLQPNKKKSGSRPTSNKVQNLYLHPDPNQSDKLDPEPDLHQFADDKPKCMEYEPI